MPAARGVFEEPTIPGQDTTTISPRAVLTGASSGIGAALAVCLAQRGYELVLVARSSERLARLVEQLPASERHVWVSIDLARPAEIETSLFDALGTQADPDVLINCAGVGLYRPFLESSSDDAARLMNVNYFSAAELIRMLLPGMLSRGRGHIINVASISAKIGPWGHSAYAPSKAALVSLTQTLAAEHARSGVRFSYVNPGIVDTEYFINQDVAPLWQGVRKRAISAQSVARRITGLLDRPRLELCVPRHYRLLELLSAIHAGMAHRLVAWQSRPRRSTSAVSAPATGAGESSSSQAESPLATSPHPHTTSLHPV
jgi:short-subunit dehydrogenase